MPAGAQLDLLILLVGSLQVEDLRGALDDVRLAARRAWGRTGC